jgi:hypothetical protein
VLSILSRTWLPGKRFCYQKFDLDITVGNENDSNISNAQGGTGQIPTMALGKALSKGE